MADEPTKVDLATGVGARAGAAHSVVVNDTVASTTAEQDEAGEGCGEATCTTRDSCGYRAVGADAQVVRGANAQAGELGHMLPEPGRDARVSRSNRFLETVAGPAVIAWTASPCGIRDWSPDLPEVCDDHQSRLPAALLSAATRADRDAQKISDWRGRAIGLMFGNVYAALAPQVVVGERVANALALMPPRTTGQRGATALRLAAGAIVFATTARGA